MNNKELKSFLADTLQLEAELYDFSIACLNKIYGEKAVYAVDMFNEWINHREYGDSLNLECLDHNFKRQQEEIKKQIEANKKKEKGEK